MPIYEYRCQDCDKVFEKIERSFDEHAEACPACGGESRRIISNTSFVLKGSGWYVTDYCNRNGGADSGGNGGKPADAAAKSDAPAAAGPGADAAPAAPAATPCAASGCGAAAGK
jgi:putative FmdB family regulatory protein